MWVSGLIAPDGVPGLILQAIRDRRLEPVASWELASEVAAVLRQPSLRRRYRITDDDVASVLELLRPFLPTVEVEVEIRDPKDAPVVASALAGSAAAIVTGDDDLLGDANLEAWLSERGIRLLSPRELLARIS